MSLNKSNSNRTQDTSAKNQSPSQIDRVSNKGQTLGAQHSAHGDSARSSERIVKDAKPPTR